MGILIFFPQLLYICQIFKSFERFIFLVCLCLCGSVCMCRFLWKPEVLTPAGAAVINGDGVIRVSSLMWVLGTDPGPL